METPISESKSYLDMTFGLVRKVHTPPTEAEEMAVRTIKRLYQPTFTLNWHGASTGVAEEPYPGLYPGIEFNADHPESPRPPLVDLQADLFYCSPGCLRQWFLRMVDQLEGMLQNGQVDGQLTNPRFVADR